MVKSKSLMPDILHIIQDKGTEPPFSGKYNHFDEEGSYLCRQCGLALFRSSSKFATQSGWPSFDECIAETVRRELDSDGTRTEILCARCDAHLGHVFKDEGYTSKNIHYCVNSLSLDFVSDNKVEDTEEALFAGGCFWGVEYYVKQVAGVVKTEVGYMGGTKEQPTYEEVCAGNTGHYEAIRIIYDPKQVTFEEIIKTFFNIHDPTQADGQGPDIGEQYLSAIFYYDEAQKKSAEALMSELIQNGYEVKTKLLPIKTFWPAEDHHQNYYTKTGGTPYCHRVINRI